MPSRRNSVQEARRAWHRNARELADQLRTARLAAGLTQRTVGEGMGGSQSEVARREQAAGAVAAMEGLAVHAAAVGLRLSVKAYPVGGSLRDAAQARAIAAFVERVGRRWRVVLEAPTNVPGDLRAVDVLLVSSAGRVAVEVITRLVDLQAQLRAAQLKVRDVGAGRLVVVVTGTHANRRALGSARPTLVSSFDLNARHVLAALEEGRDPGHDAVILF
jgi:hypothetical protein